MRKDDPSDYVKLVLTQGDIIKAWASETAGFKATNAEVAALIAGLKVGAER